MTSTSLTYASYEVPAATPKEDLLEAVMTTAKVTWDECIETNEVENPR